MVGGNLRRYAFLILRFNLIRQVATRLTFFVIFSATTAPRSSDTSRKLKHSSHTYQDLMLSKAAKKELKKEVERSLQTTGHLA